MFYNNNPHNAENYSVMGIGNWGGCGFIPPSFFVLFLWVGFEL